MQQQTRTRTTVPPPHHDYVKTLKFVRQDPVDVDDTVPVALFLREPDPGDTVPHALVAMALRESVDRDDTVPVALYSRPYERVEILPDSKPYERIEIELDVDVDFGTETEAETEIETERSAKAAAPSPWFRRVLLITMAATAFALGFTVPLLLQ